MASTVRTTASPMGMAGWRASVRLRSVQHCSLQHRTYGFAGRPAGGNTLSAIDKHGIGRPLGLAGGGSG